MDVVVRTNEIKNFIQSESLLSKLKKHINHKRNEILNPSPR